MRSRTDYIAQKRKLRHPGLDVLFDDVFISDQIGFEKPDIRFFMYGKTGIYDKKEVLIVGDSLTSDMQEVIMPGYTAAGIILRTWKTIRP